MIQYNLFNRILSAITLFIIAVIFGGGGACLMLVSALALTMGQSFIVSIPFFLGIILIGLGITLAEAPFKILFSRA